MKFLSAIKTPALTITQTKRKCIIDEVSNLITLYESTVKIELSIPSIWQGIKDRFYSALGSLLIPNGCPA